MRGHLELLLKIGTNMSPAEIVHQLFQCCDDNLGNAVLKTSPDAVEGGYLVSPEWGMERGMEWNGEYFLLKHGISKTWNIFL